MGASDRTIAETQHRGASWGPPSLHWPKYLGLTQPGWAFWARPGLHWGDFGRRRRPARPPAPPPPAPPPPPGAPPARRRPARRRPARRRPARRPTPGTLEHRVGSPRRVGTRVRRGGDPA